MDLFGRHRIALNNAVFSVWDAVEAEFGPAVQSLEDAVNTKDCEIEDQAQKLEQLEVEIVSLREENTRLRENRSASASFVASKAPGEKEYVERGSSPFTPLDGERHLRTLSNDISPPKPGLPALHHQDSTKSYILSSQVAPLAAPLEVQSVQTDLLAANIEHSAQDYEDLLEKYDQLHAKFEEISKSHRILQNKLHKDKKTWKVWVENDQARRELAKQQKSRGKRSTGRPVTASPTCKSYITPAKTESPYNSPPHPPTVSPEKPIYTPILGHSPPRKRFLFPQVKAGATTRIGDEIGRDIPPKVVDDKPALSSEKDEIPSDPPNAYFPSSIPETPEEQPVPESGHISHTTRFLPDSEGEETQSSDVEVEDKGHRIHHPPLAQNNADDEQQLPPPLTTSRGIHYDKEELYGGSPLNPVEIKSEPKSSESDGPGYYNYEHESLDLDDIGERPEEREASRKRRRISQPFGKERSLRNEKSEAGYPKDKALPRFKPLASQLPSKSGIEEDVPTLPMVRLNERTPTGLRTESQLVRPKTPEGIASAGPRTYVSAATSPRDAIPARTLQNVPRNLTTRRGPVTTSNTPIQYTKPVTEGRKRRNISVLADGTDGDTPVEEGNRDIHTDVQLENLLSTPAPKSPSLKPLSAAAANSRAVNRKLWDGDGFLTPSIPRSQMKVTTAPPKPKGQNPRKRGRDIIDPDITDFRINPAVNDGKDYAFQETVRNKEARKCLPGCTKQCCKDLPKFAEAAGVPDPGRRGPRWASSSPDPDVEQENEDAAGKFVEKFGRHRDYHPRAESPAFFWDAEFPDTQKIEQQRMIAEERNQKKLAYLTKEAEKTEKGGKGRYVRK